MAVKWVMVEAPFFTKRWGDGEVRGELHGRMGSLYSSWDLGSRNYLKTGAGCSNRLSLLPVLPHPNPLPQGEGTFEIVS